MEAIGGKLKKHSFVSVGRLMDLSRADLNSGKKIEKKTKEKLTVELMTKRQLT